jgi:hypothetical protein
VTISYGNINIAHRWWRDPGLVMPYHAARHPPAGSSSKMFLTHMRYLTWLVARVREGRLPLFTDTGGLCFDSLIAIMLFRLRMSVDDAINIWDRLAMQIFSKKKLFFKDGKYKASRLEDAVLQVIREAGLANSPRDEPLHCDAPPRWYVACT